MAIIESLGRSPPAKLSGSKDQMSPSPKTSYFPLLFITLPVEFAAQNKLSMNPRLFIRVSGVILVFLIEPFAKKVLATATASAEGAG